MTRTKATVPMAAFVLLAGTLTACTPDDPAPHGTAGPPVRAGYQVVSEGDVSLQVPAGWVKDPSPRSASQILKYGTSEQKDGAPRELVAVSFGESQFSQAGDAAAAQAANTLTLLPGSRQSARRQVDVAGAGRGVITTITVPSAAGGINSLYDLVAVTPAKKRVLVRVTSQSNDTALADAVLGSVRIQG